MNIDRKVIEQALDALNHGITEMNHRGCAIECMPLHHATKALREALAHPQPVQQEPVGWIDAKALEELEKQEMNWMPVWNRQNGISPIALYTSPQAAQPQPVQQEPCPECDGTGTVAGSQAHFPCPLCTSPQAPQPQPVQPITNYLEEIYAYLCSTSPKGYADEAFRNVPDSLLPDSVRNRLAEQGPSLGADAGAIPEHAGSPEGSDGRDGESVAATKGTT